jgi:hypothetical protein
MFGDVPAATSTVRAGNVIVAWLAEPASSSSAAKAGPSRVNTIARTAPRSSAAASMGLRFSANVMPSSSALITSS